MLGQSPLSLTSSNGGATNVQIYIDINLKNSTRQPVNEDTTVSEVIKSIKTIFGGALSSGS